jgi:hypothetical protein
MSSGEKMPVATMKLWFFSYCYPTANEPATQVDNMASLEVQ